MALRILFAGIFSGDISPVIASLVGFTGLVGGVGRYRAILQGRASNEVDRATALGFFGGLGLGCLAVVIESTT
jgi:hypothetical protein